MTHLNWNSPEQVSKVEQFYQGVEKNKVNPFIKALVDTCTSCSPAQWKQEFKTKHEENKNRITFIN